MKNHKKFWQLFIPILLIAWAIINLLPILLSISDIIVDIQDGMKLASFLPILGIPVIALLELVVAITFMIMKNKILLYITIALLIIDIFTNLYLFDYLSGNTTMDINSLIQLVVICLPQILIITLVIIGKKHFENIKSK